MIVGPAFVRGSFMAGCGPLFRFPSNMVDHWWKPLVHSGASISFKVHVNGEPLAFGTEAVPTFDPLRQHLSGSIVTFFERDNNPISWARLFWHEGSKEIFAESIFCKKPVGAIAPRAFLLCGAQIPSIGF